MCAESHRWDALMRKKLEGHELEDGVVLLPGTMGLRLTWLTQ